MSSDISLLIETTKALMILAIRANELPLSILNEQVLGKMESALKELRRCFAQRTAEAPTDRANSD